MPERDKGDTLIDPNKLRFNLQSIEKLYRIWFCLVNVRRFCITDRSSRNNFNVSFQVVAFLIDQKQKFSDAIPSNSFSSILFKCFPTKNVLKSVLFVVPIMI